MKVGRGILDTPPNSIQREPTAVKWHKSRRVWEAAPYKVIQKWEPSAKADWGSGRD